MYRLDGPLTHIGSKHPLVIGEASAGVFSIRRAFFYGVPQLLWRIGGHVFYQLLRQEAEPYRGGCGCALGETPVVCSPGPQAPHDAKQLVPHHRAVATFRTFLDRA